MTKENNNQYSHITGKVKWFNQFKGYGFIEIENFFEDVFLHFSVINQSGIEKLNNNDIIICDIAKSEKGFQVTKIIEISHFNKHEIPGQKTKTVKVVMKWFNPAKGFGFAQMPSSNEDVFIHSNLLKKHKIKTIEHGQIITLTVHYTNFGYEALDIISTEE